MPYWRERYEALLVEYQKAARRLKTERESREVAEAEAEQCPDWCCASPKFAQRGVGLPQLTMADMAVVGRPRV